MEVLPGERTIGVTYEVRNLIGGYTWLSLCFITFVAELGHFYVADAATDSHDTWTESDDTLFRLIRPLSTTEGKPILNDRGEQRRAILAGVFCAY